MECNHSYEDQRGPSEILQKEYSVLTGRWEMQYVSKAAHCAPLKAEKSL